MIRLTGPFFTAALSGILVGCAFPPLHQPWLALLGLVFLFHSIRLSRGWRSAALYGFIGGTVACLITTWPLSTAGAWTGWAQIAADRLATAQDRRWWFLQGVWLYLSVAGGGLFWALFAALLKIGTGSRPSLAHLVLAPALWVLVVEWLRSLAMLDYLWNPLGNALLLLPWLAQSASIGGIWLLSALVVATNGALYVVIAVRKRAGFWVAPALFSLLVGVLALFGWARLERIEQVPAEIGIAAVQFSKAEYTPQDYTNFWMDKHYLRFVNQAFERFSHRFSILLLPESVGFGNISLDGSRSKSYPDKTLSNLEQWSTAITPIMAEDSVLVLGMDTVENGVDHNSMIAWDKQGLVGRYDKRKLVPFAEYRPRIGNIFNQTGKALFAPGVGPRTIQLGELQMGSFICQEVLFPGLIRESVIDGANLLISSGNDGVFSSPAVANAHADAARVRAIESGRYLIRAMKSGVSAVISPSGQALARADTGKNSLIYQYVTPIKEKTLFSRYGNSVVYLSTLIVLFWLLAGVHATRNKTT